MVWSLLQGGDSCRVHGCSVANGSDGFQCHITPGDGPLVVQIEGASYRLSAHTDLIPEHVRANAPITPPPAPKRRGRPSKNGRADL